MFHELKIERDRMILNALDGHRVSERDMKKIMRKANAALAIGFVIGLALAFVRKFWILILAVIAVLVLNKKAD